MQVSGIGIYPVKGCRRIELERAVVEPWGLAGDRRWLIVDAATGVAITLRDHAILTQVNAEPFPTGLTLHMTGRESLTVTAPTDNSLSDVTVWRFQGPAMLVDPAADEWFSQILGLPVQFLWSDDPTRRAVNPDYGLDTDRVSFADGYPVSLANTASLAALNDLIIGDDSGETHDPVVMKRFRSNVIISGAPAWIEDEWTGKRIMVGEVPFRVAKPNGRCLVTTIDPDTGVKGREPLRVLGQHRNVNQELLFAAYLIPDGLGTIAVGDPVSVL